MARLPRLRGKQIVTALKRGGFEVLRVRGSHHYMKHTDGRTTVVPVHAGEQIGPGLFKKILNDCEMTIEQIEEFL